MREISIARMPGCLYVERKQKKSDVIQERIMRTSETPHPQPSAFRFLEAEGKRDEKKKGREEGMVLTIESPRIIEIQKHTFYRTYVSALFLPFSWYSNVSKASMTVTREENAYIK